ncbi:MAG: ribonuclease E inhibitor RraB [Litorimonas sp.]
MTINRDDFPKDDDGEVLYNLSKKGVDLQQKRFIEFTCYVQDEQQGVVVGNDLHGYGYETSIFSDLKAGKSNVVSLYIGIFMMPKHALIVLEQERINIILEPYGTKCDGWVTQSC